ncbi:hypothetical protein NNA36_07625 [Shimia sp. CNT1-13L.2]|uniref:hypothetical protein n=1 Tax=Shimia sp. CNT1-13L.2 TaxID=2959663 RepID=UPI0020CFE09F|nr:hypothetical protein [Shimia sp. CNT1-13L.2]MCP9481828.1 hypothetical protein [Shimia sp. CNT1-13L.2]
MNFVVDNQLPLLLGCFATGIVATAFLFRLPKSSRAWKIADLVWVLLGGIGAVTAILAGIYTEDTARLDRQIDIAYTASHEFDADAARFRLRYCLSPLDDQVSTLCEKVEFLSASTAGNSDLPLFLTVTRAAAPLQGLNFLVGRSEMPEMQETANAFDPAEFLAFEPRDAITRPALAKVRLSQPVIAADFQILADSYDELITQVSELKQEWEFLQDNALILVLQIIALCLVAFAAPFRLGKSLVELI